MPKGITRNGLWRGRELIRAWVERESRIERFCACGCGQPIIVKPHHFRHGVPVYVQGHHARVKHGRYIGVDRWVEENQGRHLCACGCGGAIDITAQHHATAIPRYIQNHGPRPNLGHGLDHPCYVPDRTQIKSRNGRGFTPWVLKQILTRAAGHCEKCGVSSDAQGLECDHIVAIALGGSADLENGQALCHQCHVAKTRRDRAWVKRLDQWARSRGHSAFIEVILREEAA